MKRLLRSAFAPFRMLFESWFFSRVAPRARSISGDIVPGLDGLLRELTRLQDRIDGLELALAEQRSAKLDAERARAG